MSAVEDWKPDGVGLTADVIALVKPGSPVHLRLRLNGTERFPRAACGAGLGEWWTGLVDEVTCTACRERGSSAEHDAIETGLSETIRAYLLTETDVTRPQIHANQLAAVLAQFLRDLDTLDDAMSEPCEAEIHSWDHYRPEQIDSYWIRCTRVGPHDEHQDSNTGAHWKDA